MEYFLAQITTPILLIFVVWLIYRKIRTAFQNRTTNVSSATETPSIGGKIVKIFGVAVLYFFIAATGVMMSDSPNSSSSFGITYIIGVVWLLTSLVVGVVYPAYSGKATRKWLVIFSPILAIPIFIILVWIGSII